MLEFVHVSGASGGKDLQTRRKVRSQAMRDFRRRQREEREAGKAGGKSHAKRLSVPHSRSVSPAYSGRERATSTSSVSTEASSRRRQSSRSVPSPRPMPFGSQKDGESYFQALQLSQPAATPSYDISAVTDMENWQLDTTSTQSDSLSAYWQPAAPRDPSPSDIPQEPSSWDHDSDDFFSSTAQIGQMLGFCRSYLHWLRPGVDTETAGKILGQAWDQSKDSMLLAACCLASVGHLDSVQPNRPPGNYEIYKANVLRHISERMQAPDTATSDETIGALACLLSFEMSKGSGDALTHLQGLHSIVTLKGGLDQLQLDGLSTMIQTLDLIYAVMFESHPMLTDTGPAQTLNASKVDSVSEADAFQRLVPILTAEQEGLQRSEHMMYADQLEGISELLHNASGCLNGSGGSSPTDLTADHDAAERFRTALVAFGQHSCLDDPLNPDALHLGRCCYFTFSTLFNVIVNRAPHRHARNQKLVEQLFDAIRRVKNSTWESIPYLRLFILLSAAVTTNTQGTKGFFKAELVRSIFQMGTDEWKRIEAFILRFLDVKRVLERPERRSSAPIEMDTSNGLRTSHMTWQIPHDTTTFSPGSGLFLSSIDQGNDLSDAMRVGVTCSETLSKTPSILTTAAGSLHATPYEENIDPFLEFGSIDEY